MQLQQIGESYVAMPVHYMSCQWPLLVTAHQDRYIHVWNLQHTTMTGQFDPVDLLESQLKFATTSLSCFGDGKGFAVGSIEGRCAITNYDLTVANKGKEKDFCFKCHRNEDQKTKQGECFTVNAFAFNQKFNTLASFGGDGLYITWNKDHKTKYKTSKKFPSPVTTGDFSWDGALLAYAIGYDWSLGDSGAKARPYQTLLYVRACEIATEVHKQQDVRR